MCNLPSHSFIEIGYLYPVTTVPFNIGWIVLAVFASYFLIDLLIWALYRQTISRWILNHARANKWFRWIGIGLLALLGWHWFWGLPNKEK